MKQLPKVGEVGRCETLEELVEIVDSANQKWDLDALKETPRQLAKKGQPFPPSIFDELSQEDLDWLTKYFGDVAPIYWVEVFHKINRLFQGQDKLASDLLGQTRELLPAGVPNAPVFLCVAEAYNTIRAQGALLTHGKGNAFEHADNLVSAIDQFESDLATFQQLNQPNKGLGHVHMAGVELYLRDSPLTRALIALRETIAEQTTTIDKALGEIRSTNEGIVPGDRHQGHFGDRVYRAFDGCEKLIALRWARKRGPQKKALAVFAVWGIEITPGGLRQQRLRKASDMAN